LTVGDCIVNIDHLIKYGGAMREPEGGLLSAAEAASRLGVKPETLYAYVSRGLLRRRRSPDDRRSWFEPSEVERLAERSRQPAGQRSRVLGIESSITSIQGDRYRYRGVEATGLAREGGFERVAHWLWTGEWGGEPEWHADARGVAVGRAAQAALPAETLPLERLRVIVAAMATVDELRLQLDPPAVVAAGQSLIAGMVACLPDRAAEPAPGNHRTIAGRLWAKLAPGEPEPGLVRALDAALVLLADHELAASTVAARAAASVRADPYAVVCAGLAVASGTLHAGASLDIEALLAEAGRPERGARAVGERLRRGERIRGFGHAVYQSGDPRAAFLLDLLREAAASAPTGVAAERLAVAEAVLEAAANRRLAAPNVDFALATLASMAGMTAGAGEAIFVVARSAGWLAHALEEYERGRPIRPRAAYTGPEPAEREDRGDGGSDRDPG
jgi:citrate synthase